MTSRPVPRFVASALIVLVLVTGAATTVAVLVARSEAEQEARETAQLFAHTVMAPLQVEQVEAGEPTQARAALQAAVEGLLENGSVHRVKVWRVEGGTALVVYSDRTELEGLEVPVSPTLQRALDTDQPVVVPVPDDEAHATETASGLDLLEVYLPFEDADGNVAVVELYLVTHTAERTTGMLADWLPVVIGGPVLLLLATLPLALRMARARSRAEQERAELADRALAASESERRQLARRLHDGLVQDLSALGMALELDSRGDARHTALADRVRSDIGELRSVLDDLHPPQVEAGDLREAFAPTVGELSETVPVTVSGAPLTELTGPARQVLFRSGLELLRNAVQHSGASRVELELVAGPDAAWLEVRDDGHGFDPDGIPPGHHGLRLVRADATEVGATVHIDSSPAGSTARVLVPR